MVKKQLSKTVFLCKKHCFLLIKHKKIVKNVLIKYMDN